MSDPVCPNPGVSCSTVCLSRCASLLYSPIVCQTQCVPIPVCPAPLCACPGVPHFCIVPLFVSPCVSQSHCVLVPLCHAPGLILSQRHCVPFLVPLCVSTSVHVPSPSSYCVSVPVFPTLVPLCVSPGIFHSCPIVCQSQYFSLLSHCVSVPVCPTPSPIVCQSQCILLPLPLCVIPSVSHS